MGELERISAKRTRSTRLQEIILATVGASGVLATAILAPNVLISLKKLGLTPRKRQKESVFSSRDRLINKGFLVQEGNYVRLTSSGEKALSLLEAQRTGLKRSKRWDKKWRVLIFDIPEKKKGAREKIRKVLHTVGFVRLQDSVWIYPFPCDDFVALLKAELRIGKDMQYMIVDTLEYDYVYRKYFGLE